MNTFKQKSLYAALAGLGALGATGVAQAVSVNHDGLGQALIYPYYTVRTVPTGLLGADAAYNSLLSVVNSTASAKAVKVRFLEGKNSREVLDFNLFLSAKDVWTAAIIPTTDGAGIFTADKSCTVPAISTSSAAPNQFVNFAYVGDSGGDTLDRTREGYAEIIEMGDLIGTTAATVTHSSGVPACSSSLIRGQVARDNTVPGSGGLFGSMTLINVLKGEDFGLDPTALDGFSTVALWAEADSINPTLAQVNPKTSVVVAGFKVYVTTGWQTIPVPNAVDPVSAVLMHNNVYNEFVLDVSTHSATDWVVTMPTKREYVFKGTGAAQKLFQNNFSAGGSCDEIGLVIYDREERTRVATQDFSPPPPQRIDALCNEANVITYLTGGGTAPTVSTVFGSKNFVPVSTEFVNGWIALSFPVTSTGRHQLVGPGSTVFDTRTGGTSGTLSTTFNGLPVIGFSAIVFENSTLNIGGSTIQSNYGGNFNHKTTTSIVP
ncbi:MAG: hypothetical protein IT518_07580 [Burkholderiales bacterium]|nr:hypothetical protein [Burkholderiales bacterium]